MFLFCVETTARRLVSCCGSRRKEDADGLRRTRRRRLEDGRMVMARSIVGVCPYIGNKSTTTIIGSSEQRRGGARERLPGRAYFTAAAVIMHSLYPSLPRCYLISLVEMRENDSSAIDVLQHPVVKLAAARRWASPTVTVKNIEIECEKKSRVKSRERVQNQACTGVEISNSSLTRIKNRRDWGNSKIEQYNIVESSCG
ncbi:hypothetical protein EVAR_3465_1 [Eumeta japonica]|uniref:Uncharacterized protein n=1 Tax=Eumeta variegata TaxID=151549 RepID=A0A4C1SSP8_EUMVA|nr:hypothetical protein EVAR_3465_1 [Eumeta japonica]